MELPLTGVTLEGPGNRTSEAEAALSKKATGAAEAFEALLLTQLLRSARAEGSGWLGSGEDAAADQAVSMAEEFLARALSAQGGLGIARMVGKGLAKPAGPRPSSEQRPERNS